jgi:ubiquinone/menaquinone biosynthesis C-methylase UbiE
MLSDFGALQKETWQSDLKRGFAELFRVLKPNGFLIFKWSNQQISSDKLIALSPYEPLFYQVTSNKRREKSHSDYQTLWFCFMKIPEVKA